ncbi:MULTISPECIES: lysophospholipid acyltransferase family protein [Bacillaceae]|uniref:lysophospholipid acyltransferase family protein n=1 Tax=Bacillaceae TaxID=186817 RepID=UPI003000693B
MVRLITCFLYMSGYLIYSIPTLRKMKRLSKNIPVSERDLLIHKVPKMWSRTIMKITGSRVSVEGQEFIPDGPVVFVANHEGDFDVPSLLGYINKPFGFVSKMEVMKVPILSSWMEVMNCIFLDRRNRRQAVNSIREGAAMLKRGHSILIFPEGTRSKGGPISPFKTGSFHLAKDAGVPIVPISIKGTSDVFEKNNRFIRPATITITIGQPINPQVYANLDLKELAENVRQIVIRNLDDHGMVS